MKFLKKISLSQALLCSLLIAIAAPISAAKSGEAQASESSSFKSNSLWKGKLPTDLKQAEQDLKQMGIVYKYYPPRKSPGSWLSFQQNDWEGTLYFDADLKSQLLLLKSPEYLDKKRFDQQLAAYLERLGEPSKRREGYQNPVFEEQIWLWPIHSGLQYKLNLHTHLQQERWQIWEARSLSTKN